MILNWFSVILTNCKEIKNTCVATLTIGGLVPEIMVIGAEIDELSFWQSVIFFLCVDGLRNRFLFFMYFNRVGYTLDTFLHKLIFM